MQSPRDPGFIAFTLSACKIASVDQESSKENSITPIYITIAGHIEDVPVYTQCNQYQNYRDKLLVFAAALSETGAAFNLQIEYEFFVGAARCETEELKKSTNGQNVIDYLASHYGFEIDPHQEGGVEERPDNYADIRFLGETITPAISENVGGLVWDDPQQFARLARGEQGWLYPNFTWYPEILTLAVSHAHHTGDFSRDDIACGIWSPKGAYDNFWIHDPGQQMYMSDRENILTGDRIANTCQPLSSCSSWPMILSEEPSRITECTLPL